VVRAIDPAANGDGIVNAGDGVARGRIQGEGCLRVVDAILRGVHAPGESHFELLRAFADDARLEAIATALAQGRYRTHEFGDFVLIERQPKFSASETITSTEPESTALFSPLGRASIQPS
jgi:S-adenosylmethionine:tRNA ribosyltransferase-isomerase